METDSWALQARGGALGWGPRVGRGVSLELGGGAWGGAEPGRALSGRGLAAGRRPASPTFRPGAGPEGGAEAGRRYPGRRRPR